MKCFVTETYEERMCSLVFRAVFSHVLGVCRTCINIHEK